jgi:putative phosphoesterase
MRVAVIADLHANRVATEAAIADIRDEMVDSVVCLGDVASTGPDPRGTLALLRSLDCPVVMGNADAELLDPAILDSMLAGPDEPTRWMAEIARWNAGQLSEDDRAFIRSFQPTVTIALDGEQALLCVHGSPRSFDDIISATTADEELDRLLEGVSASIVIGGHTHLQMVRRYRGLLLVNAGSVGLPYTPVPPAEPIYNPTWAEYAIVTADGQRLSVDLRRVPYALDDLQRSIRESGMPHAAWWAGEWH